MRLYKRLKFRCFEHGGEFTFMSPAMLRHDHRHGSLKNLQCSWEPVGMGVTVELHELLSPDALPTEETR